LERNKDNWRALFDEYDMKQERGNPFEPKRLRWSGKLPNEHDFRLSEPSHRSESDA